MTPPPGTPDDPRRLRPRTTWAASAQRATARGYGRSDRESRPQPSCTDRVTVEVIDTGVGIPADEQAGLFTWFFRSSLARQLTIPVYRARAGYLEGDCRGARRRDRGDPAVGLGTAMVVVLPLSEVDGLLPVELTCANPRNARSLLS
jgi:hypothetical protein